ncbi:MAG: DUF2085 domain-containing protein [Chloroflexi bacterium]|nr:DUF2085 domain-containing protein [Chloroflexota bacterium]
MELIWGLRGQLLAAHWLPLANLAMALTLAGAVAAPALRAVELDVAAEAIYTLYLLLCPQRPSHSYFLFGYQLALEQRPVAMVAVQLAAGLAYILVRGRLRPLDWRWLALFSLPLAWDGFSQMFDLRDSDWLTRSWTGGLFNLALVWWAYPRLDRALLPAPTLRRDKAES